MIRWLEDNPFGKVLASVCLGLLVVSLLLAVIWALPASSQSVGSDGENSVPKLDLPELAASETIDKYVVITERPVFNNTRLPSIELDLDDGLGEELLEEDVDAPDVQLTGVIITPSIRMATLRPKQGKAGQQLSLVAFEGRPLEGNYGSWQVSRIDHREVTLSSGNGEEVQLKLEVHGVAIAAPPKPDPGTSASGDKKAASARNQLDEDQPLSRAEEIRQRIAERREELRRASEDNEQADEAEKMSYQQAIQAMMGKNRQEKTKNE
jgi:hypothetical protein